MKLLPRALAVAFLALAASAPLAAQETPLWDVKDFIIKNHIHQISGGTTVLLALGTGTAALLDNYQLHPILAYSTIGMGAVTLALGLTAFGDQLDEVWPHALLMGLAETGWILNGFVLEPGTTVHKAVGAASIVSLAGAIVAIVLIKG